ncbi:endonuclease MutS2 [Nannocystis bainbridge]|uniref:Endonuclease MutS2 n=1 Tax=Nannocystis bainbridge TaxID=2995303 RepID=A0ABT5DP85_9BACT|nr:Smr/MutS family protein [Nannocystis bainbridge]MDC0715469.1 Smr/MutS family protein [Nannocystis bainbridge]
MNGPENSRTTKTGTSSPSSRSVLVHLGWPLLCERLAEHLRTPMARSLLQAEVAAELARKPYEADAAPVLRRTSEPAQVRTLLSEQDGLQALLAVQASLARESGGPGNLADALGALSDISDAVMRASRGVMLLPAELLAALRQLQAVKLCVDLNAAVAAERGYASDPGVLTLATRLGELHPQRELAGALGRSIAPDGPEGEPWVVDGASPGLQKARQRVRELKASLMKAASRLVKQSGVAEVLQDSYYTEREGRIVLPVRADAFTRRGSLTGIIHDSSATGQTLFVEPSELMEENNSLRAAQMQAAAEERRVLEQLSRSVGIAAAQLRANQQQLIALDAIHARLRFADAYHGLAPEVGAARASEDEAAMDRFELIGARHPLMVLSGVEVVPNDILLELGSALVISGPNAGGKTVALKTLGLCALMAQAGLRLPTRRPARLPLVRAIVTDVGDDQSIAANLSTFSAHMQHVCAALASAQVEHGGTLVLLDEIAVGTDPEQGAALAEAILLALTEHGASVVTTTHYERLKLLAQRFPGRFINASVGFDLEKLMPTFRLLIGVPGPSSALTVARRLGLPEPVLQVAQGLMDEGRLRVDQLLQEVVAERDRLITTRLEVDRERDELRRRNQEVARREAAALEQAKSRKQKAYDAASAELRALHAEVADLRKQVRKAEKEGKLDVALEAAKGGLQAGRGQLAERREPAPKAPGEPPVQLVPGERVMVVSLGKQGEVLAVQGERAVVQVEALKTTVPLTELRSLRTPTRTRAKVKPGVAAPVRRWEVPEPLPSTASKHFGESAAAIEVGIDNSVDVRGARAEDALRTIDRFLDEAMQKDLEVVVVIHGHGTGALRKAVREYLAEQPFIHRKRPGLQREGGEGVTVVWVQP